MAEPVGLLFGVIALAGTFKDCVDLFSYIRASRSLGRDHEILETKLDVEKTLFLQWAQRVRLLRPEYDERLDHPPTRDTIARVLASVRLLLSEGDKLQHRYGLEIQAVEEPVHVMKSVEEGNDRLLEVCAGGEDNGQVMAATVLPIENGGDDIADVPGIMSGPRMSRFVHEFKAMSIRINDRNKKVSSMRKLRWVVQDKDKFDKLIQELSYFISKLNEIIPDTKDSMVPMLEADLESLISVKKMHLVLEASLGNENLVADIVRRKMAEICEQRILRCLWHRKIDDREQAVANSHFKTLHWALAPPDKVVEWDDLVEWLRSGSGIYWVCGKAGSGKSTLMKFLHTHATAKQHIIDWAGEVPLTTASFFFWNLGTAEQKTYNGLLRALLYDVLRSDHTLIPELLPKMWQEASQPDAQDLAMPSSTELRLAFEKLGKLPSTSRKFCYWIDGLDEYSGDYRDAIAFIKNLSCNPNIKVVVSSRPIPACVEAFNKCPRLQLQDLTKDDIATYVNDTLNQHSYMKSILATDPINASQLLNDLISKASGVFLWVVLACRSLLDGFAAYDRISDLQKRVNELPPELEDLFRHMLSKIQPRYMEQAVKLLRLCYQKHCMHNTNSMQTMAFALLEDHAMDLTRIPARSSMSAKEKRVKCEEFEGRLRSRCYGLLEVNRSSIRSGGDCLCGVKHHDSLVDSTVEFMHRSVFEFLDIPGIWMLDYLSFECEGFEANAVLGCLALHSARLSLDIDSGQAEHYIKDILLYSTHLEGPASDCIIPILLELESLLQDLAERWSSSAFFTNIKAHSSWGMTETRFPVVFLLAVEAGMANFIQLYEAENQPKTLVTSQVFPLLYHAITRPFLSSLRCWDSDISPTIVQYLLLSKRDPNELFIDKENDSNTPWASWLRRMSASDPDKALLTAELTEMFINAGAAIQIAEATVGETLGMRIKRQLVRFGAGTLRTIKGREIIRAKGNNLLRLLKERGQLRPEEITYNEISDPVSQVGNGGIHTTSHGKLSGFKRPWSEPAFGEGALECPDTSMQAGSTRSAYMMDSLGIHTAANEELPSFKRIRLMPWRLPDDGRDR